MISEKEFLLSIRDSGYKGLEWALAELVDNSIEAGSTRIDILLPDGHADETIKVVDNGCGLTKKEALRAALLGGSARYDSRTGLGRFGMGLPCSSLSQARRFEIVSRSGVQKALTKVAFDLDGALRGTPQPQAIRCKRSDYELVSGQGGTAVIWHSLDRVERTSWKRRANHLTRFIGRKYRNHLVSGIEIRVGGQSCSPIDPLLRHSTQEGVLIATPWGPPLEIPVAAEGNSLPPITVQFSLLNVEELAVLSVEDKRRLGIIGKAGVSILRAGREIDYGWFFLDRRRENYDDWWRAEIAFEPVHDELFGVSFTKQGIRPSESLRVALTPHLTEASRVLQRRVKDAHATLSVAPAASRSQACLRAAQVEDMLDVLATHLNHPERHIGHTLRYRISSAPLNTPNFMTFGVANGSLNVQLNQSHAFYRCLCEPVESGSASPKQVVERMTLLLLAFARTLAHFEATQGTELCELLIRDLSRNLKHFLRQTHGW